MSSDLASKKSLKRSGVIRPRAGNWRAAQESMYARIGPRFDVPKERGLQLAEAFFSASRGGEMGTLRSLLAADVTMHSDGGGKRPAAMAPIIGIEEVMQVHQMLASVFADHSSRLIRYGLINGLPGLVTVENDGMPQTTALEIADGKIVGIYMVRNPDKLRHLKSYSVH